jgi:hypothetical protein
MWPGPRSSTPLPPAPAQQQQAQAQAVLAQQAQTYAIHQAQALAQHQAAQAAQGQQAQLAWTHGYGPAISLTGWDQQSLASAFSTVSLNQPPSQDWYFDSGATSHMTSDPSSVSHSFFTRYPLSIVVSNGSLLPVTSTGTAFQVLFPLIMS